MHRYPRLNFENSWRALSKKLGTDRRLVNLVLVLPELGTYGYDGWAVDQKKLLGGISRIVLKKPSLEVHVVRMFDPAHDVTFLDAGDRRITKALKSMGTCRVQLAGFVKDDNWTLEPRFYVDKHGRFVVSKDLDTSVELVDILPDVKSLFRRATWA
jgi:hypothetical protein